MINFKNFRSKLCLKGKQITAIFLSTATLFSVPCSADFIDDGKGAVRFMDGFNYQIRRDEGFNELHDYYKNTVERVKTYGVFEEDVEKYIDFDYLGDAFNILKGIISVDANFLKNSFAKEKGWSKQELNSKVLEFVVTEAKKINKYDNENVDDLMYAMYLMGLALNVIASDFGVNMFFNVNLSSNKAHGSTLNELICHYVDLCIGFYGKLTVVDDHSLELGIDPTDLFEYETEDEAEFQGSMCSVQ